MLERAMKRGVSIFPPKFVLGMPADSARWIAGTLALTIAVWLVAFAGLLAISKRVHDDVPYYLAIKLPLLQLRPELIFAGDSRTQYQVDPALAADLMGKPHGAAVNIGYEAGEPLAVLAAIHRQPERFENARLVIDLSLPILNEGIRSAYLNPQDVTARLGVAEQMATFMPLRLGTLIRFIREAFRSRLAADQHIADVGPQPADFGLIKLKRSPGYTWPDNISSHAFYAGWSLSGPKSRYEIEALCEMVKLVRKLTLVFPPWAVRYDRNAEPVWRDMEKEGVALLENAGRRCGFDVLDIQSVPGLAQEDFFDESHIAESGIPIYTRYLMTQIER
jgi:hypothetical protein